MRLVVRLSNTVELGTSNEESTEVASDDFKPARQKSVVNGEKALRRYSQQVPEDIKSRAKTKKPFPQYIMQCTEQGALLDC